MKKSLAVVIVSFVALAAIGAIVLAANKDSNTQSSSTNSAASEPTATEHQDGQHDSSKPPAGSSNSSVGNAVEASAVTIENYAYSPASIRVKKGTTVTWTNQDSVKHDVMPDEPSDAFKASELLAKGESYSFTFNTVGTYSYFCSPHPYMKATVEVVE